MNDKQIMRCAKIKICFIALGACALFSGRNPKNVTGPNIHQMILAEELAKANFDVAIIAYSDETGEPYEYVHGMKIAKIHEDTCNLRILTIAYRIFRLWGAMNEADSQIYFSHGIVGGIISLFCLIKGRKFVYNIGSDALVNPDLITRKIKEFNRSRFSPSYFGNWLDIKLAHAIIVQSYYEKRMLKENFGKIGIIIRKPIPLTDRAMPEKAEPPIVLWVGSIAEVKQPELFLKLAEIIQEAKFQMIGGHSSNEELYNSVREQGKKIPNFEYLGVVPFNEIGKYFRQASILVNTSMFEAYPPYAAMQAWMNYTPVVSLGDNSDEIIQRFGLGFHSKSFEQMIKDIRTLLANEPLREKFMMNGRNYIETEHNFTYILNKYIKLFRGL